MRENVLNVKAVLSDGTIIKTGSRARKSSAGYDVTRLLIGSEGTLAIITEVLASCACAEHYVYMKCFSPSHKLLLLAITAGDAEAAHDTFLLVRYTHRLSVPRGGHGLRQRHPQVRRRYRCSYMNLYHTATLCYDYMSVVVVDDTALPSSYNHMLV